VHPLSEESSGVVDLIAQKLDLDFLVHVDAFGFDEAGHEDVGLLDAHVVGPVHPGNAEAFEVVAKPC
jgi:hypothetical protein